MQLISKVKIKSETLEVYKIYVDGRVEIAYTEKPVEEPKKELKWDLT